jgi:hypothetical protein
MIFFAQPASTCADHALEIFLYQRSLSLSGFNSRFIGRVRAHAFEPVAYTIFTAAIRSRHGEH